MFPSLYRLGEEEEEEEGRRAAKFLPPQSEAQEHICTFVCLGEGPPHRWKPCYLQPLFRCHNSLGFAGEPLQSYALTGTLTTTSHSESFNMNRWAYGSSQPGPRFKNDTVMSEDVVQTLLSGHTSAEKTVLSPKKTFRS
ncbi:hypothetical protein JZ751_029458 [Albula glossodonta]|uniref:Uncharacterized protein n=1 Tax=Albula glossodonta TaxID=121402 RepID=A0A8T2PI52_9TELE|nr:hypothetical protein JZ751_029458 [Albula glossodonta]